MKKLFVMGLFSIALFSCNKKIETPAKESNADTAAASEAVIDTLGSKSFCYMEVTGKDSVFASIDDNLGTITGKLLYKNFEKDSNKGTVSGFKSGDTLKLTYEFESEGSKSMRDIFFIQKGNILVEGIGAQKEESGQMKYADEKKISYKEGNVLKAADCSLVSKALGK